MSNTSIVVPPSADLVERVRELYNQNPSDVRFLIPVLHGLQKVHLYIFQLHVTCYFNVNVGCRVGI